MAISSDKDGPEGLTPSGVTAETHPGSTGDKSSSRVPGVGGGGPPLIASNDSKWISPVGQGRRIGPFQLSPWIMEPVARIRGVVLLDAH